MDDPRIRKLQELLEQATRLRDRTNQLIMDLTKGLSRPGDSDPASTPERSQKPPAQSPPAKKA